MPEWNAVNCISLFHELMAPLQLSNSTQSRKLLGDICEITVTRRSRMRKKVMTSDDTKKLSRDEY